MADNEMKLHVSADTKSARDEFKALGTEAQKAFNGLGEQGQIAAQRLAALDKSWDSPAKLGKAAALAKLELEELAGAVDKAGKMTPELARQFDTASQKIDTASARARAFADVSGDLKTKGELAAKGIEALAGNTSSFEGILGLMNDTGGSAAQTIAKLGFSMVAFNQGLELGRKALDGYKTALKDLETAYVGMVQRQVDAAAKSATLEAATRAVGKGLIDAGKNAGETAEKYKSYVENTLRAAEGTDRFAKSLDGVKVPKGLTEFRDEAVKLNTVLANAWKEGGDRFREYAKENESLLNDIAERYRRNGDTIPEYIQRGIKANEEAAKAEERYKKSVEDGKTAMEDKLKGLSEVWTKQQEAIKAGEEIVKAEKDGSKSYSESKRALTELAAQYGLTEEGLRDLIKANKDYKEAVDQFRGVPQAIKPEDLELIKQYQDHIKAMSNDVAKSADSWATAANSVKEYIDRLNQLESAHQAASNAAAQHQQVVNDLSNAMVANGASGRGLADIHKAMADSITAGQEPVVRMQILQIQLTEATDAAIERLNAQAESFNQVVDKENMLVDYAANILSAYQSGFTDLFTTLEQIDNLIRQLNDMLMQNMGTKFEEDIRKMLNAYKELRNEVSTGLVKKDEKLKY